MIVETMETNTPTSPRRHGLAALLLAGAALAATPAAAQYVYGPPGYYPGPYTYNAPPPPSGYYGRPYDDDGMRYGPRPIPPRVVVERLEDQGYDDVGRPRFTGTLYIVEATAPGDVRMRVTVDAIRGVILDRTALGGPRQFRLREAPDDEDDRPRRRLGARPLEPGRPPEEARPAEPRPVRPRAEPNREVTRRDPPPATALPSLADPRVAPIPGEASSPVEGRSDERTAARQEPQAKRPVGVEPGGKPYGLNPDAAAPARRKPTDQQARKPAPGTETPASSKTPADVPQATVEASRSTKPVRVIGGVTPPVAAPSGPAQLDSLPPPPDAPQPGASQ